MANPTTHSTELIGTSSTQVNYGDGGRASAYIRKGANSTLGGCCWTYTLYSDGTRDHRATYTAYLYKTYSQYNNDILSGDSTGRGTKQRMCNGVVGIGQPNPAQSSFGYWSMQSNAKPRHVIIEYSHYKLKETYLEYDTSNSNVNTPYLQCAFLDDPTFRGMLGCKLYITGVGTFIDPTKTDENGVWKVDIAKVSNIGVSSGSIGTLCIQVPKKTNRNIRIICGSSSRNKVDVTYRMFTKFVDFDDNGTDANESSIQSNVLDTKNMLDGDTVTVLLPDIPFMLNGVINSDTRSVNIKKSDEFRLVHPKLKAGTFIEYEIMVGTSSLIWKLHA